ncbi:hypothetical protein GCM10027579_10730 [Calidifontibacter terrae]
MFSDSGSTESVWAGDSLADELFFGIGGASLIGRWGPVLPKMADVRHWQEPVVAELDTADSGG